MSTGAATDSQASANRTVRIDSRVGSSRGGLSTDGHTERVSGQYVASLSSLGRPLSYNASLLAGQLPSSLPTSPIGIRSLVLSGSAVPASPIPRRRRAQSLGVPLPALKSRSTSNGGPRFLNDIDRARAREAQRVNDSMVYLDGAQVYSCAQCRTHLTSHDDIISKSFHGRHGRAYLFDKCVNVTIGPPEDRPLITGLHSVSDIFCKRCENVVGWTYIKAYEASQKYKEGKFIIEKINLHLEESDYYDAAPPAGEKTDRWRKRSMSWGSESRSIGSIVYEY